ncbi:hypothetical protein JKY72_03010 [Candidatus Gracilibacteria bacterium]|nr:hypothetical protein [Candidatus Gracilibacteria bacterium]
MEITSVGIAWLLLKVGHVLLSMAVILFVWWAGKHLKADALHHMVKKLFIIGLIAAVVGVLMGGKMWSHKYKVMSDTAVEVEVAE